VGASGDENGQVIIMHPAAREFLLVGYRSDVSLWNEALRWPALKRLHVEKGSWVGDQWRSAEEPLYEVDQMERRLGVHMDEPQSIRIWW